jgi:hypothetical protein
MESGKARRIRGKKQMKVSNSKNEENILTEISMKIKIYVRNEKEIYKKINVLRRKTPKITYLNIYEVRVSPSFCRD